MRLDQEDTGRQSDKALSNWTRAYSQRLYIQRNRMKRQMSRSYHSHS